VSGGIDSPVATWLLMRRGVQCFLLHFHNRTVGGEGALGKIEDLGRVLSRTQGRLTGLIVPFEALQRAIIAGVPAEWRMIVYRRLMLRIAEALAPRFGAQGFVTGDSISQVASQTLENLAVIHEAAERPIYTPLAGSDKTEIVDLARRIGTFEISTRPHDDCCSFLVAPHPVTRAKLEDVLELERGCDLAPLVEEAAEAVELRSWPE
jgi:thiamine biosynthesis protein ThiI